MAVPSSGQLRLYADIQVEIGGAQANTSLRGMSADAGFTTPDAMSDFYGYSSVVLPSVTTCTASGIYPNCLTLRGGVNNLGGAANAARGFRFGPYSNINQNSSVTVANSGGTGTYTLNRNTNQSSTYYWHAWANNAAGQATGNTCSTTTPACFTASTRSYCTGTLYNYSFFAGGSAPTTNYKYSYYLHPYLGWQQTECCVCTSPGGEMNWSTGGYCVANNATNRLRNYMVFSGPTKPNTWQLGCNCTFALSYTNGMPWTSCSTCTFIGCNPTNGTIQCYCTYRNGNAQASPFDIDWFWTDRYGAANPSDIRLKTNINYL